MDRLFFTSAALFTVITALFIAQSMTHNIVWLAWVTSLAVAVTSGIMTMLRDTAGTYREA